MHITYDQSGECIALSLCNIREADANARLIAAAPDMFAAGLEMTRDYQTSEQHHPDHVLVPLQAFTAMQAAIAKVENG